MEESMLTTPNVILSLRQAQLRAHSQQGESATVTQSQTPLLLLTGASDYWEVMGQYLDKLPPATIALSPGAQLLQARLPLPEQHTLIPLTGWIDLPDLLQRFFELKVALLTKTTLAKVALGVADSPASFLVLGYLQQQAKVRVWRPESSWTQVKTPAQRVWESQQQEYRRTWQRLGAHFIQLEELLPLVGAENCDSTSVKRLWSREEVQNLADGQVLRLGFKDIITPLAVDALRAKGIQVVREGETHAHR